MTRMKEFFESAVLLVMTGTLAAMDYGVAHGNGVDDFNPVREILTQNNLLEATKQDPQVAAVCDLIAESSDDPDFGVRQDLTTVFYLCNAVGHPAYAHIPYNDAIGHPPTGKTPATVKQDLRATVGTQIAKVCAGGGAHHEMNGPTLNALCRATGQPGYDAS